MLSRLLQLRPTGFCNRPSQGRKRLGDRSLLADCLELGTVRRAGALSNHAPATEIAQLRSTPRSGSKQALDSLTHIFLVSPFGPDYFTGRA